MQKRIILYITFSLLIFVGIISFIFRKEIINAYKWHRVNYDNKEIYDNVFNDYVEENYGIISKNFKVKYLGVGINNAILDKDKKDNFSMIYDVKIPIMKNKFRITIGYDTLNVLKDNFSDIISTDPKFQHLYSEWVKKQIGVDDENVEFGFTGSYETPYVEFDKITTLSEDYSEVFENTHNFYAKRCNVKNIEELNLYTKDEISIYIRENYLDKAMKITKISEDKKQNYSGTITLSNKNFDKENDLNYYFRYDARESNSPLVEYPY